MPIKLLNMKKYIALLILCVAALSGCSRSGPPESLIKSTWEDENRRFGYNDEFVSVERGATLESEGKYGPKGTKAYTIRVHYTYRGAKRYKDVTESDRNEVTDYVYYKDVFGEWQHN